MNSGPLFERMPRHLTQNEQIGEHIDHVDRLQPAGDADSQAFVRELVDDVEHPELAPVMRAGFDEVIRPDVVAAPRAKTKAGAVVVPDPPSFGLLDRDLQALTPPDPFDALVVDAPPGRLQQRADLAVAIAPILLGQRHEVGRQCFFVITAPRDLALCRAMLTEGPTGATLGDVQDVDDVLDTGASARGAQKFPRDASCRISLSSVRSAIALRSRWFSVSRSFIRRT